MSTLKRSWKGSMLSGEMNHLPSISLQGKIHIPYISIWSSTHQCHFLGLPSKIPFSLLVEAWRCKLQWWRHSMLAFPGPLKISSFTWTLCRDCPDVLHLSLPSESHWNDSRIPTGPMTPHPATSFRTFWRVFWRVHFTMDFPKKINPLKKKNLFPAGWLAVLLVTSPLNSHLK